MGIFNYKSWINWFAAALEFLKSRPIWEKVVATLISAAILGSISWLILWHEKSSDGGVNPEVTTIAPCGVLLSVE